MSHVLRETSHPDSWRNCGFAQPKNFCTDVNVVNKVSHGGGGVIVWAVISYGQWTQLHFINGNLIAQRYRDEILRPILLCHSSASITSCFSMIMHNPMSQRSVHNSCKLKMAQFFHGLHTYQTCYPLSTFGMLWIDVYDSVFQFPPISSNFEEEWDTIPQSTTNSLMNSIWRRCVTLHEPNGGHTGYWLVNWSTPLTFFLRYLWATDAYLYSHSCEIHRLEPNELI